MSKKLTTEEFIKRAKEKHGDKYDYSKTIYTGYDNLLIIICPIHGEIEVTGHYHLNSVGCNKCGRENAHLHKRIGNDVFIKRSKFIHGDKYDYSKVEYVSNFNKVCIICPEHGEFWQRAFQHMKGHGCPKCSIIAKRKMRYEKCVNNSEDYHESLYKIGLSHWGNMLERGFDEQFKIESPTYKNCTICEEWTEFEKFYEWFKQHYVDGWVIDKDILVKGNKEYAPDKCCFVPPSINSLFVKGDKRRGNYPIGVRERNGRYLARITKNYKTYQIGVYNDVASAFNAYKITKEQYIKEVADKWKDRLEPYVYEAMYNYKVEITD